MKRGNPEFFVKSVEQSFCPCCGGCLNVIGSRKRKFINSEGAVVVLIIRRLRCCECEKIHHELPDILVPYKRYGSESVEVVVSGDNKHSVAADESTIYRLRSWFDSLLPYLIGVLTSIAVRLGKDSVECKSCSSKSTLEGIFHYVGNSPRWLARVVRSVTNFNLWPHTRSAFLST